jgi:hypothetical protein
VNFKMAATFDVSDDCKNRIDELLQRHSIYNGHARDNFTAEQQTRYDDITRRGIIEAIIENLRVINDRDLKKKTFWIILRASGLVDVNNTRDLFRGIANITCKGNATNFHASPTSRYIFTWSYAQYMIQAFCQQHNDRAFFMRVRNLHKSSSTASDNYDSTFFTDDERQDHPINIGMEATTIHEIVKNLHNRLNVLESANYLPTASPPRLE